MLRCFVLFAVAFFLIGCSNTELVSSWKNPQLSGYRKILTIGISENATTRRIFEDAFAAEASAMGVTAVPSYSVLPEAGKIPKERVGEAVNRTGADAVLIMRLVAVDRQIYSTPGRYAYGGYPTYGYYDFAWHGYYEPPRIYEEVSVILESSVYDARNGDLVWSGKTRTIDPTHLDDEMHEVSKIVVERMQKQGVINAPPKRAKSQI